MTPNTDDHPTDEEPKAETPSNAPRHFPHFPPPKTKVANGNPPAIDPSTLNYLVISGGTGANSIAGAFGASPAFVLPVSDDGGSSSEILRCFGGPSIGDIRE